MYVRNTIVKKNSERKNIKIISKSCGMGNQLRGQNDFKEGITRYRVRQSINEMTESVRGKTLERKSKQKDDENLLLAAY